MNDRLQLTENELIVTLAAVLEGSVKYARGLILAKAEGYVPDREDWQSIFELQSVAKKIQRLVQMPDQEFFQFCATAVGKPEPEVAAIMIEAQQRIGGRKVT